MIRSLVITKLVVAHFTYRSSSHSAATTTRIKASQRTGLAASESSSIIVIDKIPRMLATITAITGLANDHQCGWRSSATVS